MESWGLPVFEEIAYVTHQFLPPEALFFHPKESAPTKLVKL